MKDKIILLFFYFYYYYALSLTQLNLIILFFYVKPMELLFFIHIKLGGGQRKCWIAYTDFIKKLHLYGS